MNLRPGVIQITILNIFIFIICSISFFQELGIYDLFAVYPPASESFNFYQLISYQFLHSSFEHLFFNLVFLFLFANDVERDYGTKNIWNFYLLFGIGACLFEFLCNPHQLPVIGSSGSIFGIMVLSGLIRPYRKIKIIFPIYYSIFIIILFFSEIISAIFNNTDQVAHFSHVGGGLTAILIFIIQKIKSKLSS